MRSYEVSFNNTGDEALNAALRRASALQNLRESVTVDADGLIARAIGDAGNLRDAMRSEGYYAGSSSVTLAGEPRTRRAWRSGWPPCRARCPWWCGWRKGRNTTLPRDAAGRAGRRFPGRCRRGALEARRACPRPAHHRCSEHLGQPAA
ncbi:hypothetical protein ACFQU7_04605 [Pseudoroseomonas wenyumeiae]